MFIHKKTGLALITGLALLSLTFGCAGQNEANKLTYPGDPGFAAKDPGDMVSAIVSWHTPEYVKSWGLGNQNAAAAYALGYYGQGVTVGMIDSGHNLGHREFQGTRFIAPVTEGVYGSSGFRNRSAGRPTNPFTAGESFHMTGDYYSGVTTPDLVKPAYPGSVLFYNGGHGTAMLGILGANRDGNDDFEENMHGFAFASTIVLQNTGSTDANAHGPYHDYNFMYQGYKSLVDAGSQVINSSWGSIQQTEPKRADDPRRTGVDNGPLTVWYFRTLADEEFVHFYTKKAYGKGGFQHDPAHSGRSYLDAMYDAVKGTTIVHVRSAANQDQENPNNMAFYPYFNPDAEKHWISIGGLLQDGPDYKLNTLYNEAGPYAKWWHMAVASGDASTSDSMVPPQDAAGHNVKYGFAGGTSGSSPHVTGAMALMLSRYADMNAIQVRDVLFTTAQNKKLDGSGFLPLWTAPDGEPDQRFGWGYPNIGKGMYGPGQFLSPFVYNMTKAPLDVWSNNIGEIAVKAREREDKAWLDGYKAKGVAYAGAYNLNNSGYGLYGMEDLTGVPQPAVAAPEDYGSKRKGTYPDWDKYFAASLKLLSINKADAAKWRKEWMDVRAASIRNRIDAGQYTASLTKQGSGTLVMIGDNTYGGGTTVEGGTLLGFTESFGSAPVAVSSGKFGLLAEYNDLLTMKGVQRSAKSRLASVTVNNGGTYCIVAGQDVTLNSLSFAAGSKIMIISADGAESSADTGSVTVNSLTGFSNATLLSDKVNVREEGGKFIISMRK